MDKKPKYYEKDATPLNKVRHGKSYLISLIFVLCSVCFFWGSREFKRIISDINRVNKKIEHLGRPVKLLNNEVPLKDQVPIVLNSIELIERKLIYQEGKKSVLYGKNRNLKFYEKAKLTLNKLLKQGDVRYVLTPILFELGQIKKASSGKFDQLMFNELNLIEKTILKIKSQVDLYHSIEDFKLVKLTVLQLIKKLSQNTKPNEGLLNNLIRPLKKQIDYASEFFDELKYYQRIEQNLFTQINLQHQLFENNVDRRVEIFNYALQFVVFIFALLSLYFLFSKKINSEEKLHYLLENQFLDISSNEISKKVDNWKANSDLFEKIKILAPFPILLLDENKKILWANDYFYKMWDLPDIIFDQQFMNWDFLLRFTNFDGKDPLKEMGDVEEVFQREIILCPRFNSQSYEMNLVLNSGSIKGKRYSLAVFHRNFQEKIVKSEIKATKEIEQVEDNIEVTELGETISSLLSTNSHEFHRYGIVVHTKIDPDLYVLDDHSLLFNSWNKWIRSLLPKITQGHMTDSLDVKMEDYQGKVTCQFVFKLGKKCHLSKDQLHQKVKESIREINNDQKFLGDRQFSYEIKKTGSGKQIIFSWSFVNGRSRFKKGPDLFQIRNSVV